STGWAHLHPKTSLNNDVHCLTEYNGDIIAGGLFTSEYSGTTTLNCIARWDGTAWRPLGEGINGNVRALTVYKGELIAGGEFTTAGGKSANRIARWDGSEWDPLGSGLNDVGVRALTVYKGDLYVGGNFSTAGGVSAINIARWDGSEWDSVGTGMNGSVVALTEYVTEYDSTLIAGGAFTTAGGISASKIASWDGSAWQQLGTGMETDVGNYYVNTLVVYRGDLYAGGRFTIAGGNPALRVARWDGAEWDMPGDGIQQHDDDFTCVYSLSVFNMDSYGEVLVAGGEFRDEINPFISYRLAWFDIDDPDPHWRPFYADNCGTSGRTYSALEYKGDLILGGVFDYLNAPHPGNNIPSRHIGRVKPEGIGVFDSLRSRSDFIVDIVSEDIDLAPNGADEIIVRGYHSTSGGAGIPFWVMGIDSATFTGCHRAGNYAASNVWGNDGLFGSRRTMSVGDFVDDDSGYKDLLLLVSDTVNAIGTIVQAWEVDTTVLLECAGGSNLPYIAAWTDTLETITELITAQLDTTTIELRTPTFYHVDSINQPLVVLNTPPVHYDVIDDSIYDVSKRYPEESGYETFSIYANRESMTYKIESVVKKDWGISAGLSTYNKVAAVTVKSHLTATYGEGFSITGENSKTLSITLGEEAKSNDLILASCTGYDVWEYPVYRGDQRLGDVIVVDPTGTQEKWLNAKETDSWIEDHEVENVLSYPKYDPLDPSDDLGADNPMVANGNVIQGTTKLMSRDLDPSSYWALNEEKFSGTEVEEQNKFGVAAGGSVAVSGGLKFFGIKVKSRVTVSVEGTYDQSEVNTYTTTFSQGDSLHVQYGGIDTDGTYAKNRKYEVTPHAYWARNGALVLDYGANPKTNQPPLDPTWWQVHYSDPDPAFFLPWRLDPEKFDIVSDDNRYRTKEMVFLPEHPQLGEEVNIIARVHNLSLNPTAAPVAVSFYLGNPRYGRILHDENILGNDSVFYACDTLGDVLTEIPARGAGFVEMVWEVPTDIISNCPKIWAVIDPFDSISPEVHDNDDLRTNNKGWTVMYLDSTGLSCIDIDSDQYECGDANGDFSLNVGDAVWLINYVFKSGASPEPLCVGDANDDKAVNVGDAVYMINYVFKGGAAPPATCCQ
ncbi:MAG: hypothetical protein GY841_16945, partial [FCB group bacterium]|nr:hypothetical protein [FCB group bacterium]